jgi:hypothetical protein
VVGAAVEWHVQGLENRYRGLMYYEVSQILTDSVVFSPMFRMSSERIGRETRGLTRGHIVT